MGGKFQLAATLHLASIYVCPIISKFYLCDLSRECGYVPDDASVPAESLFKNYAGKVFILGRYQRGGIGKIAAEKVWKVHPGRWEVSVIPENIAALRFWENDIKNFSNTLFTKEIKLIDFDES